MAPDRLAKIRLLSACLAFSFLGSTHQDLGNLNYNGTRPILLNSIFLSYLIYRYRVYLVFTHLLHIRSSSLYFILACTGVVRKSCSCVHTYAKATYDVHAIFSVHVCHSFKYRIIWSLLCDWLFPPLFSSFLFGVYKQYTQLLSIASPWNFTGIWHTGTCCPDIRHFTKYTSGIYSILW